MRENRGGKEKEKIKLGEVVKKSEIQKIIDSFAKATGLGACAHDVNGEPFTSPSNWCEFCTEYNRRSKIGYRRCVASDKKLGDEAVKTGKPAINYCGNGRLLDAAAPITVEGKYVGFVTCGQVLPKPPDLDEYRKIAREIGVDEGGVYQSVNEGYYNVRREIS
jgi:ligand-binding sensor protein